MRFESRLLYWGSMCTHVLCFLYCVPRPVYVCFEILSRCTIGYTYIIEQEPDVLSYTLKLLLIAATNFSGLVH